MCISCMCLSLPYVSNCTQQNSQHDDVIKWKQWPLYWPLCGEFTGRRWIPVQRPVTWSFDVFFDLCLNKPLSKQSWDWWSETPSHPLWRQCYGMLEIYYVMFGTKINIFLRRKYQHNNFKVNCIVQHLIITLVITIRGWNQISISMPN